MAEEEAAEDRLRYLLTLAYDGRAYEGWQSQANGNTVQDHLDVALRAICPDAGKVQGAGRTDSGVSALAQQAHFDAPVSASLSEDDWCRALNAHLPSLIRVMKCEAVEAEFHARFDAIGKTYRYRLYTGDILPPLMVGLAWHVKGDLDEAMLKEALQLFVGRHDFRAFSANRGDGCDETRDAHRTLHSVDVVEDEENIIDLVFRGEGFLYKMVRFLVGSAVRTAQGKWEGEEIRRLLNGVDFSEKAPFCAPPDGLLLEKVDYPGSMSASSSPGSDK